MKFVPAFSPDFFDKTINNKRYFTIDRNYTIHYLPTIRWITFSFSSRNSVRSELDSTTHQNNAFLLTRERE